MFIEAVKLINLPIASEDELSKIGNIHQIVVDPASGQLLGFIVKTGFFSGLKALSAMDIKFWDKDGLVTSSEDNLVELDEIIRIKNVLDQNINLIDLPAQTESGKSLGLVENFLIDTETNSIVKYYLKDMLGKCRVMPSDKVIKIDKTIIFTDDEDEVTSAVIEAQTA